MAGGPAGLDLAPAHRPRHAPFRARFPWPRTRPRAGRRVSEREPSGRGSGWRSTLHPSPRLASSGVGRHGGWRLPWAAIGSAVDARVRLEEDTPEYTDQEVLAALALSRARPQDTWHAVARIGRRLAGHGWSYLDGDLAGVFDVAVWLGVRAPRAGHGGDSVPSSLLGGRLGRCHSCRPECHPGGRATVFDQASRDRGRDYLVAPSLTRRVKLRAWRGEAAAGRLEHRP